MNKNVPPPEPGPRQPPPRKESGPLYTQVGTVDGRDREFLPAALEILETPPSPLPVALLLTICAFCVAALAWSYFGKLDVHAVAWGKIEARGRAKVIQPLESGRVAALRVENGSRVMAGDVLVELDPADAQADATAATEALAAQRAEIARRSISVETARLLGRNPTDGISAIEKLAPTIPFDPAIPPAIQQREVAVLAADLGQLRDTLKNLDKQMEQKVATRQRLEASIAFQVKLLSTLEGRVDMRQKSIKLDVGTRVNLFDAEESLQKSQAQLASDKGQQTETDKSMEEIASQKIKAISQFLADNETKLADAARKADDTAQQFAKASAKLARTKLVSPVEGIIQQLAVTTIGQVVTTGQQLMTVSPVDGALHVEAYVSNTDIGFVKVGQPAEIKVDSFPFTRFGTISGRVERVATDAIDEQEAKRAQSSATALANGAPTAPGGAPGQQQSFVFPVIISLDRRQIDVGDKKIELTPGMTVSAEVKTDSRRVIDYLLSPIARTASEAMKER